DTVIVPFDEIIPRILCGEFSSGVIIHEGQLTWASHGLNLVLDLGIWWNERTGGLPLPLGGNVVRNDLGDELCNQITAWVKQSIEIAINNPEGALEFARQWGRGIDEETNSKFVQMYVNERTIDYEDEGRSSIVQFLTEGIRIGMIDPNFCPEEIKFIGV
ncbi:MAG TPA: MqnA/MqnD/SBP family protein, partial [Candidatus Thalassarchaeaceae archaeon]|nr:MqnA/MqnD/SBP family protein [Candidatus Thalassarchaeaceae archaeon]